MEHDGDSAGRRRGRPRRDGSRGANQRKEIMDAAMRLFAQRGYAGVSMSAIAREAGLDQSSLYYWFSNKEDLLRNLLEVNRASTRMARDFERFEGTCAASLYGVLFNDALRLCEFPFDYYELEDVAYRNAEDFSDFFTDYEELSLAVQRIIECGVSAGEFRCADPQRAARLALAVNEGVQHRVRRSTLSPQAALEASADAADRRSASAHAALLTVSSLLAAGDARAVQREWESREGTI